MVSARVFLREESGLSPRVGKMARKPDISVVIPAYNSQSYIEETIRSVLAQEDVDLEIIVVDDGSRDRTREVVKNLNPSIRLIEKENGGPASARNLGIKSSKGDIIAFLDADDIWEPGKCRRQLDEMIAHPEIGLLHSKAVNFRTTHKTLAPGEQGACKKGYVFAELLKSNFIRTSTVAVRKECFLNCGEFNESEELIAVEDYDMWLRIACQYAIGFIDVPLVHYRVHEKGISKNIERSYHHEENVIRMANARWPDWTAKANISLNTRLSFIYRNCGLDLLENGQSVNARKWFRKSISQNPKLIKSWVGLIKSLIPQSVYLQLRKMKRG